MSDEKKIPDVCPACGGRVALREPLEKMLGGGKVFACRKQCVAWTAPK